MENNIYKKLVPKGIPEASLSEKIDPISEPIWKHNINGKITYQRFSEMTNNQLKYVFENLSLRLSNAYKQLQVYMIKAEQLQEEASLRDLELKFKEFDVLYAERNATLKRFTDAELFVEFKRRALINNDFYENSFKVQTDIHNIKKQQLIKH